ncbi:hypothetical protein L226DRAFT_557686 [Lentinus tigrinus ALCF2SS1-7]|uniref:F-box domain-containing protein n=1 Tax=Lentinus tigrinus ALCF2SS1-6 TaxID=1328759 RepID=A0A5C2SPZ1_9APHY|nr:hypothetical protein L227DRAFT_598069 [Lentinus tigrinus ALCF2SS1-6]RPD78887.1 hypothetical protein L226DRAFT_557686 [Lentinus tigrinus ALCF2SS1-7]
MSTASSTPMTHTSMKPAISIHDLPSELLIHIFRFLKPTYGGDIQVTHVCRRWRAAIHSTPEFWRDMIANRRVLGTGWRHDKRQLEAFLNVMLERTRRLPLHIELSHGDLDFLETAPLKDHLDRIAALIVERDTCDRGSATLGRVLALGPLPTLESLELTYESWACMSSVVPDEPPPAPLTHSYPKLRCLEVNPNFLAYTMMVPSLRKLIIYPGYVSLSGILGALKHCPQLEWLECLGLFEHADNPIRPFPLVHLPCLRDWVINDSHLCPGFVPQIMFRHIQCPTTTRISLGFGRSADLSDVLPRDRAGSLEGCFAVVLGTVSKLDFAVIAGRQWIDIDRLELKFFAAGEDASRISISIPYKLGKWHGDIVPTSLRPFPCTPNVASVFSSQTITELRLNLPQESTPLPMRRVDWTILFDAFPSLVALATQIGSCTGLLKALRQTPLRLRGLERLEVTCANGPRTHHALVLTVEMRASQGVHLRRLAYVHSREDVRPFSKWHLARLRAVVAEVIV